MSEANHAHLFANHAYLFGIYDRLCEERAKVVALDLGCGKGELITRAHERGREGFFGAETFYESDEWADQETGDILPATREAIKLIGPDGRLPFPDDTFDFICSNQVFEHIADPANMVRELARVAKPDAVQVHLFPTREKIVEGHVEIPLVHRLPDGPLRKGWAHIWHRSGRASFSGNVAWPEWWADLGTFLRDQTFHRPWREFEDYFRERFDVGRVEQDKLLFHLRQRQSRFAGAAAALTARLPRKAVSAIEARRVGVAVKLTSD
jgi:SAM-dependent methyltransferase